MKLLTFDPSKRATGWVLTRPGELDFGTIEFKKDSTKDAKKIKSTPEKMLFQDFLAETLGLLIKASKPDRIISEFPFGSQSSTAAWYLGMCTQAITSAAIHVTLRKPVYVLPYDARKQEMGDGHADKDCVRKAMMERVEIDYPGQYRSLIGQAKFRQEAVCDALLIDYYYRNLGSTIIDHIQKA